MKLYTSPSAPNPRRVHVFAAEMGLELPVEEVALGDGAHHQPAFVKLNPDRVVPALVLDDGTVISESVAICRYLDALHPGSGLFGNTPREVGLVSMWVRRLELQLYQPVQDAYRNSRRGFAGRALPGSTGDVPQIPELVTRANQVFGRMSQKLELVLGEREFVALDRLSMADIVAHTTFSFATRTRMRAAAPALELPRIARWYAMLAQRPAFAPPGAG